MPQTLILHKRVLNRLLTLMVFRPFLNAFLMPKTLISLFRFLFHMFFPHGDVFGANDALVAFPEGL